MYIYIYINVYIYIYVQFIADERKIESGGTDPFLIGVL